MSLLAFEEEERTRSGCELLSKYESPVSPSKKATRGMERLLQMLGSIMKRLRACKYGSRKRMRGICAQKKRLKLKTVQRNFCVFFFHFKEIYFVSHSDDVNSDLKIINHIYYTIY